MRKLRIVTSVPFHVSRAELAAAEATVAQEPAPASVGGAANPASDEGTAPIAED